MIYRWELKTKMGDHVFTWLHIVVVLNLLTFYCPVEQILHR